MTTPQRMLLVLTLLVGTSLAVVTLRLAPSPHSTTNPHPHDHAHEAGHEEHHPTGPHGGRLLSQDKLAAEITIFEHGVAPEFRVYFTHDREPLAPDSLNLTIQLTRLGGRTNLIHFTPRQDYLVGDQTVYEPHSFDVVVTAQFQGETYVWSYDSYEARVELPAPAATHAGIQIETAGPATIKNSIRVNGRIRPNEEQLKHVVPRYPGVLKEVRKRLGDSVGQHEVLAVVESNESLQSYEIKSDLAGTIIEKHAVPGEFVGEGKAIYIVADLRSVWVDLNVYRHDSSRIAEGQSVLIGEQDGLPAETGTISYISPFGTENTQTVLARVVLPNPRGIWRPGLFVTAEILLAESHVPLAVRSSAIQTFRDWTVVFVNEDKLYEPLVVQTGRQDGQWVEILSGMVPGQRYVSENSFIIKADILKSGATHDH